MERRHYTESQVVSWSVAVFCATILLVYVVLYFVKWDLWHKDLSSCDQVNNTWEIVLSQLNSWTNNLMWSDISESGNVNIWITWFNKRVDTWNMSSFNSDIVFKEDISWMKILSGTTTYYGDLDFVEKLWISYKYALVDEKWIYYLNMWDYKYDFSDIIRKLWWNLYIMNTEQEILGNAMFGDKVTYINVPEYKNSKVLILLDINDQSWLLAIDYSIYHQVKSYLKSLFITTS